MCQLSLFFNMSHILLKSTYILLDYLIDCLRRNKKVESCIRNQTMRFSCMSFGKFASSFGKPLQTTNQTPVFFGAIKVRVKKSICIMNWSCLSFHLQTLFYFDFCYNFIAHLCSGLV